MSDWIVIEQLGEEPSICTDEDGVLSFPTREAAEEWARENTHKPLVIELDKDC